MTTGAVLSPPVPGTVEEIQKPAWFWLMLWCLIGLVLVFLLWRPLVQVPERLIRAHLWAHLLLATTVVASLAYAPSQAWRPLHSLGAGYRLQGVIIPMLPPRVGEVGAILLGLALIGFVCRKLALVPAAGLVG